jgi:dynein heavy chain
VFDKFAQELKDALKSLANNIQLEQYDRSWDSEIKSINNSRSINSKMIDEFERLFNGWNEKIEQSLEAAESEMKDEKDAGPMQELLYWKQRMRKLTCISEQLRSKNCTTVFNVLDNASKPNNETQGKAKDKVYLAVN